MTQPFSCAALALSYIKGPKVDDWVAHQIHKLYTMAYRDITAVPPVLATHLPDDEECWDRFARTFLAMYTDMAAAEQAYSELTKLQMICKDVNDYVAHFEHLLLCTRWEQGAKGSLEMFKRGLRKGIHYTILQRDPIPQTIDEWIAAARREVARRHLVSASLGTRGAMNYCGNQNQGQGRKQLPRCQQWQQPQRDPNAMDIDTANLEID